MIADGRGWRPAGLILAIVAAVAVGPLALDAVAPERPADRIGFYERIAFRGQGAGGEVVAGLIAPAGWTRIEGDAPGVLVVQSDAAVLTIALRTDVVDADALLREALPVGAMLTPATSLAVESPLAVSAVEYDLAAGDSPELALALCRDRTPTHCVLVDARYRGGDDAQRAAQRAALGRMLASIEFAEGP